MNNVDSSNFSVLVASSLNTKKKRTTTIATMSKPTQSQINIGNKTIAKKCKSLWRLF